MEGGHVIRRSVARWRLTRRQFLRLIAGVLAVLGMSVGISSARRSKEVIVDTRSMLGRFNRALLSITGYAQLKVSAQAIAQDTFALLNPNGFQQRIETMIDQVSPQPGAFYPDRMFRFVDNTDDAYFHEVIDKGMEPVLLCAYNTPWLSPTGATNQPPTDPQEWANIVAQIVEHYNGSGRDPQYRLRVRYIEVWNEPNLEQFWMGTDEEYFELFRTTARTIHTRFPGVMVGGPVYSPGDPDYYDYGRRFIDAVGEDMDFFVYHSYGDSVDKIVSDVLLWHDYIASHTSKRRPKLMVTESEQFISDDAAKIQYLLDRQFALMEHADILLGWHQFCLYEYEEGSYTFGLIHGDGSVFARNYWPYWILRDASGRRLRTTSADDPAKYLATRSEDDLEVNLVCWLPEDAPEEDVHITFLLPRDRIRRVMTISRLRGTRGEVVDARTVSGRVSCASYVTRLLPGDALSIKLEDASKARAPWLGLETSEVELPLHGSFEATATLLNSTPTPISGSLSLEGLPSEWQVEMVAGSTFFQGVLTGDSVRTTWRIHANSVTDGALAFYAQARLHEGETIHSIPVRVQVLRPVKILSVPDYSYFAPGETRKLTLSLTNNIDGKVSGTIALEGPAGWTTSDPQVLVLEPNQVQEYDFTLTAPIDVALGTTVAYARATINADTYTQPIRIVVKQYDPKRPSVIVDLSSYYNGDGFSYDSNPGDGDLDHSAFSLPADTFPGGQQARYMGVLFQMPDVADGFDNEVVPVGQLIEVPEGIYNEIGILANATNGAHSGTFTLIYANGQRNTVSLSVSDWCTGAEHDEEPVIWFDHRHSSSGDTTPSCYIYYLEIPVDSSNRLIYLGLPSEPNLHIFAISGVSTESG